MVHERFDNGQDLIKAAKGVLRQKMGARRLSRVEESRGRRPGGVESLLQERNGSQGCGKGKDCQGRDKPAEDPQTSGVVLLAWEPGQARDRFL